MSKSRQMRLLVVLAVVGTFLPCQVARSQTAAGRKAETKSWQQIVDAGVDYLQVRGQADDGSFSGNAGTGPTGLVASSLLSVGVPPESPVVSKALNYLLEHVREDGGIYADGSLHQNYETCIAMVAFDRAQKALPQGAERQKRYLEIAQRAEAYVKKLQFDEGEGRTASDLDYGGAGYGSHQRPDLSNTSFLVDALHDLGNPADDEAIQKALAFVSRCQNLETPYNDSPHASKINDGGFYYTVAAGGETKAEIAPNGGLRSYGSMTYAGLKSMVYAGLKSDDARVKAAVQFLKQHYTLESNPGVGQQGLFYYYLTMAKALDALGGDTFEDAKGNAHQWKTELIGKLAATQQADGSWVNPTTRWMEGDPNLVSAYALLALSYCKETE